MPTPTSTSWPALDDQLLADAAATFNFKLGVPGTLAVLADGTVLFRRTPPREFVADLYELTPSGEVQLLARTADLLGSADEKLSDAEKARRERTRTATRGVVDIDVSDDGRTVMVPLGGVFHVIDRETGKREVIDPQGAAYDPHLSPDGKQVAFVREGDLWIAAAGAAPRQLTRHPEGFEYGVADFAAQEELKRTRGYWWSPDGKHIVFQRSDLRPMDTIYVADARHPEKAPVPFKYPRAGRPNAIVDLGVIAVAGGPPRWLAWDKQYEYISAVIWPKKGPLTAVVLDREQYEVAMLAFEVSGVGSTASTPITGTPLVVERDEAWINVNAGAPRWLDNGTGFLWMTEAKGAWTLELRDATGKLVRELTSPEFGLRQLEGLDADYAYVEASTDPPRQDAWKIPLDGTQPTRLTAEEGVAAITKAKHGSVVVDVMLATGGRKMIVFGRDGATRELPLVAERPKLVPTTQLETVQLGGRTHHCAITRPRNFDPTKRYPVLLKVYGGPHAVTVTAALDAYVMDQWYADAGFIVVRSDNRGTPNRGRAWERAILKDLISVPLEDQIGALQALGARYRELDLARVGVTGWSFGGYFSALAVLRHPDVFKAGVAGAPVTDWTLYDTAYTERYMKLPENNADGYRSTSALTYADKLTRPLLLVHGITDDNVHFAHTLAFIEALYIHAKRAEVITLSATHMVPDPRLNLAREQVQVDFFRDHLGPPP